MLITKNSYSISLSALAALLLVLPATNAQSPDDEVMLQAFYWDVPVHADEMKGIWWNSLREKSEELTAAGFTSVWTPAPSKGAYSIYDMGYGVYDHYDLGEYKQKGNINGVPPSVETRFGSKQELIDMVAEFQSHGIEVYADIVLNHMFGGSFEHNPVVTQHVNDERYPTYPTSQLKWQIPDADPGKYHIEIKGYNLNWNDPADRVYELHISWEDILECNDGDAPVWIDELQVNNNIFEYPGNNCAVYGSIKSKKDIDTFAVNVDKYSSISVRIYPRYNDDGIIQWNSDDNGYRVRSITHNDKYMDVEVHTLTSFHFMEKDNTPNLTWTYKHFNPSHETDYLEDEGFEDEVRPNWMIYGVDLNTRDAEVRRRLIDWGRWLTHTAGFDGYRLDFVRGIEQDFIAEWLNAMPERNGDRRFSVAEYWTYHPYRIHEWIGDIESYGAQTAVFDFPLREQLRRMCNEDDFDMRTLSTAGIIQNERYALQSEKVVTFLENHDTGKEHDKWITRDWHMGYAYILFSDGLPCIFYPHYYHIEQVDMGDSGIIVKADSRLRNKIDDLIRIRRNYLAGDMQVLTKTGEPYPDDYTKYVYIARRQGNDKKPGGILVLNNHPDESLEITVSTNIPAWKSLAGTSLMKVTGDTNKKYTVQGDGRVTLNAPPRSYAIYIPD